MMLRPFALGWAMSLCIGWGAASASPSSIAKGLQLARVNCSPCHAISGPAQSPVADAPRFPELQRRAGARSLDEVFAEVTLTRHPPMPNFLGGSDAMADLLDYIRSVQERPPRP